MAEAASILQCTHVSAWTPEQQLRELSRRSPLRLGQKGFSFTAMSTDVIVATPAKCGTTWLLHICHQLRMKGAEPDFDEQVPGVTTWIEQSMNLYGLDPNTMVQPAEPRIYLSHLPYADVPKGGRLVYCFRDQKDALYSYYMYLDSRLVLKKRVDLNIFAEYARNVENWTSKNMKDLLVWWEHRHDKDVLFLFFDDLVQNHTSCVSRIARFLGMDCCEEFITRVTHTTTHTEMVRHHSKFDLHSTIIACAKALGEEVPTEFSGKVRKDGGKLGDGSRFSAEVQSAIDQEWREIVTPKLGFASYTEMLESWRRETNACSGTKIYA